MPAPSARPRFDSGNGGSVNLPVLIAVGRKMPPLRPQASEQRRQDGHGAGALRVVAVPRRVPSRMQSDGRLGLAHGPRGGPNLRGRNLRDRLGPFRGELTHVRFELG